jgi:hypothetical protein
MKKLINQIACLVFGHKYEVLNTYGEGKYQKIRCVRCNRVFGISHYHQAIIEWDSELEYMMNRGSQ